MFPGFADLGCNFTDGINIGRWKTPVKREVLQLGKRQKEKSWRQTWGLVNLRTASM